MGSSPRRSRSEDKSIRNGPKWYSTPDRGLVPSMPRDSTTRFLLGIPSIQTVSQTSAIAHPAFRTSKGLWDITTLGSERLNDLDDLDETCLNPDLDGDAVGGHRGLVCPPGGGSPTGHPIPGHSRRLERPSRSGQVLRHLP